MRFGCLIRVRFQIGRTRNLWSEKCLALRQSLHDEKLDLMNNLVFVLKYYDRLCRHEKNPKTLCAQVCIDLGIDVGNKYATADVIN